MILIRKQQEDHVERTGRIHESSCPDQGLAQNDGTIGIDESGLAWLYIAPGRSKTETCPRLLTLARDPLGPKLGSCCRPASHTARLAVESRGCA